MEFIGVTNIIIHESFPANSWERPATVLCFEIGDNLSFRRLLKSDDLEVKISMCWPSALNESSSSDYFQSCKWRKRMGGSLLGGEGRRCDVN